MLKSHLIYYILVPTFVRYVVNFQVIKWSSVSVQSSLEHCNNNELNSFLSRDCAELLISVKRASVKMSR